ncbi:coniferyl aldehyde dehydrogenase [Novosphingobium profundi]|uniref:coniferyl aldehyde dehydrogenase n=1 Tax=Novosphingobium profundi TaxID=1774954 RepID=UPI001BD94293|nr:coniferyl aldehyde dehydrogenase [Novosphingobium profundi]MBT0667440.1 coniferyl aldehyde dehydrogenase [Novosphingobium profundi]
MTNPVEDLSKILRAMKKAHLAAGPANAALRRDRLERAARLITDNRAELVRAISADFGNRAPYHTLAADIATTAAGLHHSAAHVDQWMQREAAEVSDPAMAAWIEPQPLGVVGIVSPWNFPINLAFAPLAGVFAAGNTAMIKPSEFTPRTSDLIARLVGDAFDAEELGVVIGGPDVAQAFTSLPFDHLVFTGSTAVGRHVMRAAAENLVPVTLELGGKCPVVVDEGFDIATAAERTLTVKTFNAGQICLSPDYVMVPSDAVDGFVEAAKAFMARAFPGIQANEDYTSIIAPHHFERLLDLLADAQAKGATIVPLNPTGEPVQDAATRKIAPVLILNATQDMRVMQEEVFGPLLPVVAMDVDQAIARINAHDRPLAAYLFSDDDAVQARFAACVTSGALVINDIMSHASIESLPFGGVGASGIGAYHGVHGFRRFSHFRPTVRQSAEGLSGQRLRAPYAEKQAVLETMLSAKN